jgi:hypothetical protein
MTADILRAVHDETGGADGYVSFEVSPHLAHDTQGTINEAKRLRAAVDRPNVMIKVPATPRGHSAIEELRCRRRQRQRYVDVSMSTTRLWPVHTFMASSAAPIRRKSLLLPLSSSAAWTIHGGPCSWTRDGAGAGEDSTRQDRDREFKMVYHRFSRFFMARVSSRSSIEALASNDRHGPVQAPRIPLIRYSLR